MQGLGVKEMPMQSPCKELSNNVKTFKECLQKTTASAENVE